jgi:hypothetical protein
MPKPMFIEVSERISRGGTRHRAAPRRAEALRFATAFGGRAISRRGWLGGGLASLLLAGCVGEKKTTNENGTGATSSSRRRDVPLRVVVVGTAETAQAIQKSWSGIADQPLEMTTLSVAEAGEPVALPPMAAQQDGPETRSQFAAAAESADVLLYPAFLQGLLATAKGAVAFPDAALAEDRLAAEQLLPALTAGPMQYGKEPIALPLGAIVPALLVAVPDWPAEASLSWSAYRERISELPAGRAAEPLADGWAARMFLQRANSYADDAWLFDRDNFQPLLMREPYRRALEELVEAAAYYPAEPMRPDQVWQAVRAGELDIAIGWPTSQVGNQAIGDVRIEPLPAGEQWYSESRQAWVDRDPSRAALLLTGDGLVASISADCRQTAAAEEWIGWLSQEGGAGSLQQQIGGLSVTRNLGTVDAVSENRAIDPVARQHRAYLRDQLSQTRLRTMLRIPAASGYLNQLDTAVLAAIAGDQSVTASLQQAANAWETITLELGRENQMRHWRQSTGLRY